MPPASNDETAASTSVGHSKLQDGNPEPGHEAMTWSLALVGMTIAFGVRVANGTLHPVALALILAAFALVAIRPWNRPRWARHVRPAAMSAGGVQLGMFAVDTLSGIPDVGPGAVAMGGLLLFDIALGVGLLLGRVRAQWGVIIFLVVHLALSIAAVTVRTPLVNDVLVFHRETADALVRGENPYTITFPDIYPPESSRVFYGPGVSVDGELQFGYPYPPLNLVFVLAGWLISDVRVVFVALTVAAGAVIWKVGGEWGAPLSVLFLTNGSFLWVTRLGWTEPAIVLALAGSVLMAMRVPRLTPWLLGVALALKQYVALFAPLYLLFVRRSTFGRWFRDAAIALAVPLATVVPFLLSEPDGFLWSVVELQFHQPYRPESLSALAGVHNATGWPPRTSFGWLPFVAAGLASVAVLRRGDATIRGFTQGLVIVNLSFLLVSKQAFANYYFLAVGTAFIAAAAARVDHPPRHLLPVGDSSRPDGEVSRA